MAIERCDKCGKSFMNKSEVERHKMYEHPVPVSPFEDRLAGAKGDIKFEDLHRLTSDVVTGGSENENSSDVLPVGGGGRRKVPFRPFRL